MKKIFVTLGVAAMAIGMWSCDKGGSAQGGAASNDSLSILLGEVQGANYNEMWEQLPDTMKAKLSKDDFIAGFKSVMSRDFEKDRAYVMGASVAMQMANNVAQMTEAGVKFDSNAFINAFAASFKADSVDQAKMREAGSALQVYMSQAQEQMTKKRMEDQQRAMKEAESKAEPNVKAGKEFVEKQKKADPSIKTTEKGVSYKVEKEGTGAKPGKTDKVKVKYVGKHIDGSEFDSSKGEAVEFNVAGVIPGFAEVLQMMAPGAKYVAYIPADQGYGNQGTPNIEPGETLVFEIEMVEVVPATAAAAKK